MKPIKYIFFGSTSDSVLVLKKLCQISGVKCQAVVTQPARPIGRKQILTSTPVEICAKEHMIPVLSFPSDSEKPWLYANENQVIDTLQPLKADLFISASYGIRIPIQAIQTSTFGGLNVHPSLLPRWRGADPVPWAILSGDHQTGVTIVTLSETFDKGRIIAQKKVPITDKDTSDPLRTKLFEIGAQLLTDVLPKYLSNFMSSRAKRGDLSQIASPSERTRNDEEPYARKLTRDDGFIPWDEFISAIYGDQTELDRKVRALSPWPGVWTKIAQGKRLKIISLKPTFMVQLEGKKPVSFHQFASVYLRDD